MLSRSSFGSMMYPDKDSFDIKPSTQIEDGGIKFHHASITWKIVNFPRRAPKVNEELRSPELRCSDATWVLSVYPNGQKSENTTGEVIMCLNKIYSVTKEHKAVVEISVLREEANGVLSKTKHTFSGNESLLMIRTGLRRNAALRKDNNYLQNNTFTITCNIFVFESNSGKIGFTSTAKNVEGDDSSEEIDCNGQTLSKDFEALHNNPRFHDVVLKVGKHEFPAHKTVLRARSKVFNAMFEHDMKENQQGAVDLVEMDLNTAKHLLRYIYCGKVHWLSPTEAVKLYGAADRYDLEELVSKCRSIVLNKLSLDSMGEVSVFANLHEDELLLNAVISFLSKDLKNILRTDKWKSFAKDNASLSLSLIQSAILID